jgi:beta-glucosidase
VTETADPAAATGDGLRALAARFPPDFAWGVAASAYQIEGAVDEDGRGRSIWDTFADQPGAIANGDSGAVACDHYHRSAEDVALMADLGVTAYRFSVAWPRVLPDGIGRPNEAGLAFYDRLIDQLLAYGIQPVLNLYHWDLPQAIQDRGGWTHPDMAGWFAHYAGIVADRYGDRVRDWLTINEPQVFAFTAHAVGRHAPGGRDWPTALRVAGAALRAHAAAAQRIRASVGLARIGLALDVNRIEPATDSAADAAAADRHAAIRQRWFLDPLFGRGYPEAAIAAHGEAGHLAGELGGSGLHPPALEPPDFLGVNYYARELVAADPDALFGLRLVPAPGAPRTTMDWEIHPHGLTRVLADLNRSYAPPALVITENGAAFPDIPAADGRVDDGERRAYLEGHIAAAADAVADGVPLRGFFVWSLLDNFEWEKGFGQRFGLVRVDYDTQRRAMKASGEWYRSFLRAHHERPDR